MRRAEIFPVITLYTKVSTFYTKPLYIKFIFVPSSLIDLSVLGEESFKEFLIFIVCSSQLLLMVQFCPFLLLLWNYVGAGFN